jgi:hypothetical protein
VETQSTSNEPKKSSKKSPPKIPPQRMDLTQAEPSAPPLHLIENDGTKAN